MRSTFLGCFFAVFMLLQSCNEGGSDALMTVSGTVKGLKKGTIYLQQIGDSTLINVDSVKVHGHGDFSFSQELESPHLFHLYLKKADNNDFNDRITFFGEPGQININTSWSNFEKDAEVSGSKSNETYAEMQQMLSQFNVRDLELFQASRSESDSLALDSINMVAQANLLRRYRYVLNFGFNNLDSHVTPYALLHEVDNANPTYLDSIAKQLVPEVANGIYGTKLRTYLENLEND